MAVNAGDAFLSIHPELASNFGRQLASQVQTPVTKAGEQASHHFARSFGHGVATVGKGIGVGIAAGLGVAVVAARVLAPVLKQSVQGYRDHLKVVAQTTAVIRSTGGAAKVTVKHITALSDALERKTTVDGDVIQTGANMIATFTNVRNEVGKGNNIFDQATATVLDMSVALGQDTKNSAIQLGKALNDPIAGVGALSRVGVTFTKQQKDQIKTLVDSGHTLEAQKIILAELNKEFGGSAAAQATASGRMQVAFHQLQDTIGSILLPVVDQFQEVLATQLLPNLQVLATRYGPGIQTFLHNLVSGFGDALPSAKQLSLGLDALGAAFSGEGITTSGDSFVGKMERIGVAARKLVDGFKHARLGIRAFGAAFSGEGITSTGFVGQMEHLGVSARGLVDSFKQAGPKLREAGGGGQVFANSMMITAPVLDVVARNVHNLIPWLPAILAGFLAFRAIRTVTGPLVQIGELISNLTAPFRIAALFGQKRALQAHTTALIENTAAMRGNAVSAELSTAAGNAGIVASIRARAAMIGQAIAAKAVAVASKAWAAVQWLVNAALTANPIGIVIVAIAALAAGIIYAYRHSENFRRVVDTVFKAIRGAVGTAVNFIIGLLRSWLDVQFNVVAGILRVMGKLPGPMGAPFRAAERAVVGAKKTVDAQLDKIQARVNKLTGKDIPITASLKLNFSPTYTQKDWVADRARAGRMATGGLLRGPGGPKGDRIPIMASDREFMQPADAVAHYGVPFMEAIRKRRLPRFAVGGPIGQIDRQTGAINRIEARGTGVRFHAGLAAFVKAFGGGGASAQAILKFIRYVDRLPYSWGGVGPGSYDCSGLVGEIWNRVTGHKSYVRRWTTQGSPQGPPMYFRWIGREGNRWKEELPTGGYRTMVNRPRHAFTVGLRMNLGRGGHTIGNFMGLNFEAANPRAGIRIGSASGGPWSLPWHYYLPQADRKFGVFDQGGFLPPGLSMAYNGTGQPEPVGIDYREMAKAFADELRANPPRVAVEEILAADARMGRRLGGVVRR